MLPHAAFVIRKELMKHIELSEMHVDTEEIRWFYYRWRIIEFTLLMVVWNSGILLHYDYDLLLLDVQLRESLTPESYNMHLI